MNLRRVPRIVQKQFVIRPMAAVLFLLVAVYLAATLLIMLFGEAGFGRAASMIIPAFLGELGTVEESSIVVQASIIAALIASVGFLAVITARITTAFVEFCMRGGSVVKKVNLSDHIVIAGWNFQGKRIVRELLSGGAARRGIAILADCEQRPVRDERVEFVRGEPTQDDDLLRAGVKRAVSVIVLSDLTKSANEADAEALMIVLAVESLNRSAHTSVQVLNSSNRIHLERAHADEIVCLDQMGGNLMVASATNHGVSQIVSELLTFNSGSEFYRCGEPLSDDLAGKEFAEAVRILAERRRILLGFETDDSEELRRSLPKDVLHAIGVPGRVIVVNPQGEYRLRRRDALFLIAEARPERL